MLDRSTIPAQVDLQDVPSLGGEISRAVLDRMLDATMRLEGTGPFQLQKGVFTRSEWENGFAQKYFQGRTWRTGTKVGDFGSTSKRHVIATAP